MYGIHSCQMHGGPFKLVMLPPLPPPPVTGCTLLVARSTSGKAYLLIFDSIHHCLVILQAIHGNFTARPTAEST